MIKYCSECGAKIENGARYCGECGTKLEIESKKTINYSLIINIISFFLSIVAFIYTIKNFVFLQSAIDYVKTNAAISIRIGYIFGFILVPMCLNIISYVINLCFKYNNQDKLIKQMTYSLSIIIFCLLILQSMILLFA